MSQKSYHPILYTIFLLFISAVLFCNGSTVFATTTSLPANDVTNNKTPLHFTKIQLTAKEQKWLRAHPVIRVGHSSLFEPMMIKNSQDQLTGTIPDIYTEIAKRLGVRVTFFDDDWETIISQTQRGNIDVIGQMSEIIAQRKGLLTTSAPFANLVTVFTKKGSNISIDKDNDLNGLKVAYHKDILFIDQYFESRKGTIELIKTNSPLEAFQSLLAGKADVMVGFNSNSYLLSKYFIPEIEPVYILKNVNTTAVAAIRPNASPLVSILKKALQSFTQAELRSIISKWSWMPGQENSNSLFTKDELIYLKNKPYLSVASLTDFIPFNFIENDKPTGYSVEYMKILGEFLDVPIRFINDSWANVLGQLKSGDLDIIPHIAYTQKRDSFVTYTNFNHITYNSGFAVRNTVHITSINELAGKTVAVIEHGILHEHIKRHHPDIILILVATTRKAIDLVAQDKAFAALGSLPYLNYYIQEEWHTNLKTIAVNEINEPGKIRMPMGVSKDNVILASILEKAHASIPPEDIVKLKQKWMGSFLKESKDFSFTKVEQNFIEQYPKVRFRIQSNRPPFEFSNNGEPAGIAVDYLNTITKKIGITPEFIFDDRSFQDSIKIINGDRSTFDTLSFTVKNTERTKILSFGDTYLSYPMMIISHQNGPYIGQMSDLRSKTVAVEAGYLTNQWLKKDYPQIDIIAATSTEEALQMVNNEEVDAYVGNLAVANYMINHKIMTNLKIVAPSDYGNIKFDFVAPKEWPELASLLSKGYRSLSPQEQNFLNQRWFTIQVVETISYSLFWKILSFVAVFIILILWWNRFLRIQKQKTDRAHSQLQEAQLLLKMKNDELEILSQTDKLTSLFNRVKLDEVLLYEFERSCRYNNSFGVIMIDIDNFKNINDTFGHQVGDTILIEVAQTLRKHSRKTDTVGRWGGEEFLIVCPHTEKNGLLALAANLREKIAAVHFPNVGYKTASFGATLYQDDLSIESILSRADAALYQSKDNGRNRVTLI